MIFKPSEHAPVVTSYDGGEFNWCRCDAKGVDSWETWERHVDGLARVSNAEALEEAAKSLDRHSGMLAIPVVQDALGSRAARLRRMSA